MASGPRELQSLPVLLAFLGVTQPKLVLAQGLDYWRVEDALSEARRKAKSGSAEDRETLKAQKYWFEPDEDGRVLIMRMVEGTPEVLAAEVGSRHIPPPGGRA